MRAIRSNSGGLARRRLIGPSTTPPAAEADVVLVEDLRDRVVAADVEHDVVDPDALGVDELAAGPRGGGRHPALEDEHAVVGEVTGGVLEASDLVVLCEEIADRVEDEVHEPVGAAGA